MSNLKNILFLFITVSVLTGCSDFLDEDLTGDYSSDTYYKTVNQATKAVNAAYVPAAFTDINNCLWVFGDVASDDSEKGGEDGDGTDIGYVDDFEVDADNGYVEYIWEQYYEGIARANSVIYYVPNMGIESDTLNRVVGEAKFLRAYYYFNLVNIFGEIPLRTTPLLSDDDISVALSSVEDIYAQIDSDLVDAAEVLPDEYGSSETGRATKGAAYGLLAKAYLFQEKWQKSLNAVNSLDSLNIYSLLPIYRHNFEVDYENNEESVFEIQHLSGQDPAEGSYLNQYFSPNDENGYYFNAPTQDLVDEFECTSDNIYDPRYDYSIAHEGGKWMNGEDFDASWSTTGFMGKKHVQPLDEISASNKGDADLNYTYMRYAEVLLIKAEDLNELGKTSSALEPLNEVRERARNSCLYDDSLSYSTVPDDLLPDVTSTDQSDVREAIRHERRVELNMEFHRYFDLMRYGEDVAEDALSDKDFDYDEDRYFPIPQSELDANDAVN